MSVEHHRKAFSATLSMPKHTALAVCINGGEGAFHGLFNCEVLMIACQYFNLICSVIRKTDKIF